MASHDDLLHDPTVIATRDLIRFDTTNWGNGKSTGEREAAEYLDARLRAMGLETVVFESEPRRTSVVARVPGRNPAKPALVVHGHTDVVPADASHWSVDPFGAEVRDGCIWGRGAVDMKNMDAMIISSVRDMLQKGLRPRRDLIIAFFADEEAGGGYGAGWMVDNHPELFSGATEAISEVGGYSTTIRGQRVYLVQTAEKGLAWLRLLAHGTAGHGSMVNDDNPITRLAGAISRIGAHEWPEDMPQSTRDLLEGVSEITGIPFTAETTEELISELGTVSRFVGPTLRNTSNPTILQAGYKHNVIPATAQAFVDCRVLPGQFEDVMLTIKELVGEGIDVEPVTVGDAVESPFSGRLVDTMKSCLLDADPGAIVLPHTMSGGTDNKSLARLGIVGYGFAPLQLTDDLDFAAMFHGKDERVALSSLDFGTRVLSRFLLEA